MSNWVNRVINYARQEYGELSTDGRGGSACKATLPQLMSAKEAEQCLNSELKDVADEWINSISISDLGGVLEEISNIRLPGPGPQYDQYVKNFVNQVNHSKAGFDFATSERREGNIPREWLADAESYHKQLKSKQPDTKPINYYLGTALGQAIGKRLG